MKLNIHKIGTKKGKVLTPEVQRYSYDFPTIKFEDVCVVSEEPSLVCIDYVHSIRVLVSKVEDWTYFFDCNNYDEFYKPGVCFGGSNLEPPYNYWCTYSCLAYTTNINSIPKVDGSSWMKFVADDYERSIGFSETSGCLSLYLPFTVVTRVAIKCRLGPRISSAQIMSISVDDGTSKVYGNISVTRENNTVIVSSADVYLSYNISSFPKDFVFDFDITNRNVVVYECTTQGGVDILRSVAKFKLNETSTSESLSTIYVGLPSNIQSPMDLMIDWIGVKIKEDQLYNNPPVLSLNLSGGNRQDPNYYAPEGGWDEIIDFNVGSDINWFNETKGLLTVESSILKFSHSSTSQEGLAARKLTTSGTTIGKIAISFMIPKIEHDSTPQVDTGTAYNGYMIIVRRDDIRCSKGVHIKYQLQGSNGTVTDKKINVVSIGYNCIDNRTRTDSCELDPGCYVLLVDFDNEEYKLYREGSLVSSGSLEKGVYSVREYYYGYSDYRFYWVILADCYCPPGKNPFPIKKEQNTWYYDILGFGRGCVLEVDWIAVKYSNEPSPYTCTIKVVDADGVDLGKFSFWMYCPGERTIDRFYDTESDPSTSTVSPPVVPTGPFHVYLLWPIRNDGSACGLSSYYWVNPYPQQEYTLVADNVIYADLYITYGGSPLYPGLVKLYRGPTAFGYYICDEKHTDENGFASVRGVKRGTSDTVDRHKLEIYRWTGSEWELIYSDDNFYIDQNHQEVHIDV